MHRHALSPLFDPKSLVLVSRYPLPVTRDLPPRFEGRTTLANFADDGTITVPPPAGLGPGERPDLAVVWVEPGELERALAALSSVRPRAAIVHTLAPDAAFCRAWAADHDCVLIGPHSLGMQRPPAGLNASQHATLAGAGRVALVAQSRAIMAAVMDWADDSRTAFSLAVALDDGDLVNLPRMLDFLASDPHTDSIALYFEEVGNAREFMSALRGAAGAKPVVVLKPGRAQAGPAGAPLRPDTVVDAALRRAGALRVQFFVQLFSTIKALSQFSRPRGQRVALLCNGEAQALLAQDLMAVQHAVTIASLSMETRAVLAQTLSSSATVRNPVIERAPLSPRLVTEALRHLLADPGVDGVLVLLTPDAQSDMAGVAQALSVTAPQARKPVLTCLLGDGSMRKLRDSMAQAGVATFRTPETATDAFGQVARYHYNQQLLLQTQPPEEFGAPPDVACAETIVDDARAAGRRALGPDEAARLLGAFHIPVLRTNAPAGVLAARLRIVRDAVFGPVLGITASPAWPSPSSAGLELVPLNGFLARRLIERSQLAQYGLLSRISAVVLDKLEDLMVAFSEMAAALPDLQEGTLEPVALGEASLSVHAACIKLTPAPAPRVAGHPHLTIAPYPRHWVRTLAFDNGEPWTLRPIRPEDAEPLQNFIRGLSEESRYMRFISAMRELPARMLARYTQIDYHRELALIATVQQPNPAHRGHPHEVIIGLAHYLRNADGVGAEYALVIADGWQRRRLGPQLMRALIAAARDQGLLYLEGTVLATNRPMIKLMTSLGFRNETYPDDASMRRIWLDLTEAAPADAGPSAG
ncbi:GNAT family N-acetyltransferase [Verticiella sediminum]|uniref:GNAT family N-acetyltransferase n=1 Tax=Verticiella sediminum TaxID=1247510 RepID=A0A556ALY3_9BURK|nr:GNAT family N-acetyltransferase [Verticiella sediminum]TSH93899.1 GNAT family N-acetyltransferase [Verticiella sediminum]